MYISKEAYEALKQIGRLPAEAGGILGMTGDILTDVWYDYFAGCDRAYYKPSVVEINSVVDNWQRYGKRFAGVVHSHRTDPQFSPMDLLSGQLIMQSNGLDSILLGLFYQDKLKLFRMAAAEDTGVRPTLEELEVQILQD